MLTRTDPISPVMIVAIGASAGGLAAFTSFLANMPADSGMAFVLLQHLAVDRASVLDELLSRHTKMPVEIAEDGMIVLADHVYILPADASLTIHNGRLQLGQGKERQKALRVIDLFFVSLAEDQQERAACIVLSGTGDDGSIGLRAIKEHGGLTMAQADAGTTGFGAMPENAFETGLLDARLPVAQMPEFLLNYARHLLNGLPLPALDDGAEMLAQLGEVLRHVRLHTGHDFSGYKNHTLLRRIRRRMGILKIETIPGYIAKLAGNPAECTLLLRDFLIGVTQFFRDEKAFKALRHLVAPLLAACSETDPFRVWVPACATGEEVYSIAMLLKESANSINHPVRLQIFASDIDEAAIAVARAGRYHHSALAAVPQASRRLWFTERDGMMEPVSELREICVFSKHNVLSDPPFSRLHLISCRNLMIYFGNELQDNVLGIFHYALRPDGLLFLGMAEGLGRTQNLFNVADKRNRIFKHSGLPASPLARREPGFAPQPYRADRQRAAARQDWLGQAVSRVMARHSPVHLIIDAAHEVVQFSAGAIADYLDPAPGLASLGLFNLLNASLHGAVRQALAAALRTGRAASQQAMLSVADIEPRQVEIFVEPLFPSGQAPRGGSLTEGNGAPYFAVAFSRGTDEAGRRPNLAADDAAPGEPKYDPALAQVEAINEELRYTLNEHQAVNEELRSANEELEASREEMQSVNEELQTVNAELNSKNDLLVNLNNDFRNLLDSTHIATLFLDSQKCVKSFTPNIAELFALRSIDIGRPINDLNMRLDYTTLDSDLEQVLASLRMIEREVTSTADAAGVFIMRMRPYRRVDDSIDGVVLTFMDITERKKIDNQMWHQAHHDQLTGLPNRLMFHLVLAGTGPHDTDLPATLLLLDLDRFKNINDAFGHRAGDQLLQLVAARLCRSLRAGDMVYRIGGDEFAITQSKARHPGRTLALADRVSSDVSATYEVDGYLMNIGVSIGIAFRADTGGDSEELVRAADIALYDAKARDGNNRQIFQPGMRHRLQDSRELEADLRTALEREELTLLFQPLVCLADRRIAGAEALIRWCHPKRGLLSPADFINIAEITGLIAPIGRWVLNAACKAAATWPQKLPVAVNLSSVQFNSIDLVGTVREVLELHQLPPERLAIEVTETVLLKDNQQTQKILAELHDIGVRISIDDFGTGYSSLSYLHKFHVDKIKIDRAFTQAVEHSKASRVIVTAIVEIGRGLGIEICAEGAETDHQIAALEALNVKEVQGFGLYPPMSLAALSQLLSAPKG